MNDAAKQLLLFLHEQVESNAERFCREAASIKFSTKVTDAEAQSFRDTIRTLKQSQAFYEFLRQCCDDMVGDVLATIDGINGDPSRTPVHLVDADGREIDEQLHFEFGVLRQWT